MAVELSAHERSLIEKAVAFFKAGIEQTNTLRSADDLKAHLHCGSQSACHIKNYIVEQQLIAVPPAGKPPKEEDIIEKDKRIITLPRTRIHTLEELIEFFKIDLDVWEVERFVANKWEVGAKNAANDLVVEPLYQVKAFLRRKRFATLEGYVTDNARLRSQVEKLRHEVRSERELTKRLAQNHAGYDDLLANFKEFAQIIGDLSIPQKKFGYCEPLITPAVSAGHTEDVVQMISDTHYGDQIKREDTSGFPEFDLVIGGNRTGYMAEQGAQILTLHRAMYPIRKLIVWVGGDIGNGELHNATDSNQLFLPAQVHFSYHMLKFWIEDLLALTVPDDKGNRVVEELVLLFTVGNHMRLTEKMPLKLQAARTLDWLIYQFLIERFQGRPNITIRQEMSPYIFENIRGHRHLFCHGNQVGFKNSPDAQCKTISSFIDRVRAVFDSPEWRRKNNFQGETFARACIGDIHIPVEFPRFISNGSLNGQNELGVNWNLEPIPVGQQLWGVTEKHLQTFHYFIEATHVQRDKEHMNRYGEFAAEYADRFGR